ncbi:MAG TPA: reverse transcriptase domain-containing protein [Candidatus Sulfotelmatobacter sp.]|nr:reverse transcriptase domain-containing protein [Candidatus Sulfotelmatobacter sp.]
MKAELEKVFSIQAKRSVAKHNYRAFQKIKSRDLFEKRTGLKSPPARIKPKLWELERQFNPFYVRSKAKVLAHSISQAIVQETYQPRPALHVDIPKVGGGKRTIALFTVVDSAIASWLYQSLMQKNLDRISDYAFAFRPDKNGIMAVRHLSTAAKHRYRFFIVEYDFKSFFDEIDHKYLSSVLHKNFNVTKSEMFLIERMLKSSYAEGHSNYSAGKFVQRSKGIPQGSTLSLFLANAVCYELDKGLENLGVRFARFADDLAVVCDSYELACKAANLVLDFSRESGVPINFSKPGGISLITPAPQSEIRSKRSFSFLGHEIGATDVRLSEKRIERLKKGLSTIIYRHLLFYPKKGRLQPSRVAVDADWDLVKCVNELRRKIYGRLTEDEIGNGIANSPTRDPISVMSSYPLVDCDHQLTQLDGWLAGAIERAYSLRVRLAQSLGIRNANVLSRKRIISGSWYKVLKFANDTRLPSLCRSWMYARKCYATYGERHFRDKYEEYG